MHAHRLRHRHGWHCKRCGYFGGDRNFCPECGYRSSEFRQAKVTIGYFEMPRYYYHRPPSGQADYAESGQGLKSYKNKNYDGSTPSIERAFGVKDPSIIWLSPERCYGTSYVVDLSMLDEKNIRPTGQYEGNVWHLGDIPAEAVIGKVKGEF